jgi:cytoskeletal protein RodZ
MLGFRFIGLLSMIGVNLLCFQTCVKFHKIYVEPIEQMHYENLDSSMSSEEAEETDEAHETDEADEAHETDEADEADEAHETDEADEADEAHETDEADEAHETDEADEADEVASSFLRNRLNTGMNNTRTPSSTSLVGDMSSIYSNSYPPLPNSYDGDSSSEDEAPPQPSSSEED